MQLRSFSQTRIALGGATTLSFVANMSLNSAELVFRKLWRQVFNFEKKFSRFIPNSELSVFNQSTGVKKSVSPEFRDILLAAVDMGRKTSGLYNPFILPALQRAGYINSANTGYEKDKQIDYRERSVVDFDRLVISNNTANIPYNTAIDLGGCGKGYLADLLGKTLQNEKVQGYWLSLGGDVATFGHDENGNQFCLGIQDAKALDQTINWQIDCPTNHFAVATSGTFRRNGQSDLGKPHHIIDPFTQKSAETDILLATVCACDGFSADVLASCAVILGSKMAPAFLKANGATSALIQFKDKNGQQEINKFGNQFRKVSKSVKVVFEYA